MDTLDIRYRVREIAGDLLAKLTAIEPPVEASLGAEDVYRQVSSAIDDCLSQLSDLNVWGATNQLPSSELWNLGGHLMGRGWLQNRARTKPRGYAGDHELLARIYTGQMCEDPWGRFFDRYFQEQAAPQAVRNRMALAREWIEELARQAKVISRIAIVGSALGLEVRDAVMRLDEDKRGQLHVTLIDLDPAAIDAARERLANLLPPEQMTTISTNIFRLPERTEAKELLRGTDLLVCPGLFDYLDDGSAAAMLRYFFESLVPGGRMVVFQFAPHNPTRAYMEWFANWYLTYRNAEELRQVVESASLTGAEIEYGAEALGIDLLAAVRRKMI